MGVDTYGQSDEDQQILQSLLRVLAQWEPFHQKFVKKADHFYSLYRNYQDLRRTVAATRSPRGRDSLRGDAESEFGRELFVPLCFQTVETIIPAMLAGAPTMQVYPRTPFSEANLRPVKALIERQQDQVDYHLKLQTIAKDGLIYGTGIQKTYWRKDFRRVKQVRNSAAPGGGLILATELREVFDDPDAAAVDPIDFIPDPFCDHIENADGTFHRTWRSNTYVRRMAESKQWRNLDQVKDLGSLATEKYQQVHAGRNRAGDVFTRSGSNNGEVTPTSTSGERGAVHEVLEYHDGSQIITILDRKIVVARGENPHYHGELPFQVYRPTENTHSLYGIGEIEPIEQLQEEFNSLRTQRRYNADLVLQRTFAYAEGYVEKEDIAFGPGYAIPVNGDPREALFQLPVGEIPNSSYQEEDRMLANIERVSGISDVVAGAGLSSSDTATGVQSVMSAASRRIENKTLRLHLEVINPGASQWIAMDQQRILQDRQVRVPAPPQPGEPDRRWNWEEIGPQQLMGEFEFGSGGTEPENIPQDRADAQMGMTLFAENPVVDQHKLVEWAVKKMGVTMPEEWIAPPNPTVPAEVLDLLVQAGVSEQLVAQALVAAGGPDLLGNGAQPVGQLEEGPPNPAGQTGEGPESGEGTAPPPAEPEPEPAAAA